MVVRGASAASEGESPSITARARCVYDCSVTITEPGSRVICVERAVGCSPARSGVSTVWRLTCVEVSVRWSRLAR